MTKQFSHEMGLGACTQSTACELFHERAELFRFGEAIGQQILTKR